jgi:plastocyanin
MRRRALIATVLTPLLVGCASTGAVRGTVSLPARASSSTPTPAGLHAQAAPLVSEVVVYVQETPPEKSEKKDVSPGTRLIAQTEHRFVPSVVPVEVGTRVTFENRDRVYHSVFSVSQAKKFDVGMYAPGKRSKSVTFDRAGQVDLFCSLDASMAGYVLVLPHRFYVQPDAGGRFKLDDLPAGDYTVKAWHPRFGTATSKVEVERGRTVETQLKVPAR